MDSGDKDTKKKMTKSSKEFIPKSKPTTTINNADDQLAGQVATNANESSEYQAQIEYPTQQQFSETYFYYYHEGHTEEQAHSLACKYWGIGPYAPNASVEGAEGDLANQAPAEECKVPAEKYNHSHKGNREAYSSTKTDGGYYDDYGFYYLPDGSFYDPNGYFFNQDGKDEHGGYYNDNGEYVEPTEALEPQEKADTDEVEEGEDEEDEKYTKEYIEYVLEQKYFENMDHLRNSHNECFYLKVGNLAENTTKYDLLDYFKSFNVNVKHVTIVMEKNKHSLIARLEIYYKPAAIDVLKICGSKFKGKQIIIETDEENERYYCGDADEYYQEHDEYDDYDDGYHDRKYHSKGNEHKEHTTSKGHTDENTNKHA